MSQEQFVLEDGIGLPFIHRVATIQSQNASRIVWHSHPHMELILVADGGTGYEFRAFPQVQLNGGQFLLIPADVEHRGVENVRGPTKLSGIMISPQALAAAPQNPFDTRDIAQLVEVFHSNVVQRGAMTPHLRALVGEIPALIRAVKAEEAYSTSSLNLRLCVILIEVAKQVMLGVNSSSRRIVDEASSYMRTHWSDLESVDKLAAHVQCSRATLFKTFKESTGMSPHDYWQRLRVEHAQSKLKSTKQSVTQIALDCGFNTSQYFSSVFRKYTGITPRQYRKSVSH